MSTPLTAQFFLRKHFEVLSAEFDIYMVANFEQNTTTTYSPFRIISAEHIGINREINLTKDLKAVADLRKYLKMMKFDAILSVTPKAGLIGMLAGRWAGIPHRVHIFTGQVWHTRKGVFKQLLIALDKLIRFNATETLVDGESQRQFLIANGVVRAESSKVLGKGSISGVDLNRFVASEAIRHKWRSELGYNAENVVFMFLENQLRQRYYRAYGSLSHVERPLPGSPNALCGFRRRWPGTHHQRNARKQGELPLFWLNLCARRTSASLRCFLFAQPPGRIWNQCNRSLFAR